MFKKWGITLKLVFSILVSTSLVLIAILGYDYYISRQYISKNIDKQLNSFSELAVDKIEETLRTVEQAPEITAVFLEVEEFADQRLEDIITKVVGGSRQIFGAGIFYAPQASGEGERSFAPYCYRTDETVRCQNVAPRDYDYVGMDWYQAVKLKERPQWGEPHLDLGGSGANVATYSVPFYRQKDGKRVFQGVVTADISFTWLQEIISSLGFGKGGYGFLIGRDGNLITHPKYSILTSKKFYDLAIEKENKRLEGAVQDIMEGKKGQVYYRDVLSGDQRLLIYDNLPTSNLAIGIDFPKEEIVSDLIDFDEYIILMALAGLMILFIVIYFISNSITRSLRCLDAKAKEFAGGNIDFEAPKITTNDEVGRLSRSFVFMRDSLKERIRELTVATAIKERMLNELMIARQIQFSMVPKITPYFTKDPRFDLACMLEPAKEVAGDFYDFYFLDKDHLFIAIGDVVGKGVPAALLMSMSRTLIKAMAKDGSPPVKILKRLNKEIFYNYRDGVFVTVFCAVLDLKTGELKYANAGHNPPLRVEKDGSADFLPVFNGTVAGAVEDPEYREEAVNLDKTSAILLYTDGATEIFNKDGNMFGEERFLKEVEKVGLLGGKAIIGAVLKDLKRFAGDKEQDDDITMLFLRYMPENKDDSSAYHASLTLPNDLGELTRLKDFIEDASKKFGLDKKFALSLNQAVEELFTNIVSYAFTDQEQHTVQIDISLDGGYLTIEVSDDGRPFNPLKEQPPVRQDSLADTPSHGWGLMIVKAFADQIEYKYEEGRNRFVLKKKIGQGSVL